MSGRWIIAAFCLMIGSDALAGGIALKLVLSNDEVFQDEAITADIKIINASTVAVNVLQPVEGSNVWLEIRDSSDTYVGTRPINLQKGGSKDIVGLQPEGSIALRIGLPAAIKGPSIPAASTTTVAAVRERLRERLSGINLAPGRYFVRAVYLSAPESAGSAPADRNWDLAVKSNTEQIYVESRKR